MKTYYINGKPYTEFEYLIYIRNYYMEHVPLGYTAEEIHNMSNEDILDMDYFLNE